MCIRAISARTSTRAHEPYDQNRDALALKLIEACVERGVPLFGICRGFQEMNVAFGGSLHPEIRDLPGRMNHRMPRLPNGEIHPDLEVIFADRHDVRLTPGGVFAKLLGAETIRVNSLHGQGILEPGKRVVIEGVAEDDTIEAIAIADAPGFALGVQWHAEHEATSQSDQSHAVRGLRRGAGGVSAERADAVQACRARHAPCAQDRGLNILRPTIKIVSPREVSAVNQSPAFDSVRRRRNLCGCCRAGHYRAGHGR